MGERLYYPAPDGERVVNMLDAAEARLSTDLLLDVIRRGYELQFERHKPPVLPPNVVHYRYASSKPSNVKRYRAVTERHYQLGSRIAAVLPHARIGNREFMAFAKVTPAEAATDGLFNGCYLNDVIAHRPYSGAGSIALHAALTQTGYSPDDSLVLEAFTGSPVNAWYERLGLEPVTDLPADDFVFSRRHRLPMTYYATPPTAGVGDVIAALEAKRPQLGMTHT